MGPFSFESDILNAYVHRTSNILGRLCGRLRRAIKKYYLDCYPYRIGFLATPRLFKKPCLRYGSIGLHENQALG
jgi:hypothetical protein